MKLQRLAAIAKKEFLHVVRDWRSLFLSLAIPIILIMLFGYALTLDLRNVPTVIWDQSGTPQSRELIDLFAGSPYFSIKGAVHSYQELHLELDRGSAMVAVVVPSDFARKISAGKKVALQILSDGHWYDLFHIRHGPADGTARTDPV